MATNIFLIGNIMVRGIVVCIVASSFSASLQLANDHVVTVSNITDTANPWVLTGEYNRPHCILMLLNCS